MIYISFDACKNTIANPDKCAPLDEIYKFAQENIFYAMT